MKLYSKTMQRLLLTSIIILMAGFAVLFNSPETKAEITHMLNFAGKVTNTDGSEITDGNYEFSFSLYDSSSGGTELWSETLATSTRFVATIDSYASSTNTYTYTGATATSTLRIGQHLTNVDTGESVLITAFDTSANTISVVDGSPTWEVGQEINTMPYVEGGVIDENLGSVTDLSGVNFDQPLYLEITFNGETMQPRKMITAVAQAFNSDTLDGYHASDFANLADDAVVTGSWTFNNNLAVVASSSETALTITQNGSGDIVNFFDSDGVEVFTVNNDGYVGIGTSTPAQQLSLTGNIQLQDTVAGSENGVIYKGNDRFIHNFNYGDNGTVTTLGYNTFVGENSGNFTMGSTATSNYQGSYNTGIGYNVLSANTTGYRNTAIGSLALDNNTSGYYNTALGYQALTNNISGYYNTAVGPFSLYSNSTGYYNSVLGSGALYFNTGGDYNIALGTDAGRYYGTGTSANTSSNNSVYLGYDTRSGALSTTNEIVIGSEALGLGSNSVVLGNDSITTTALKGNVGIGMTSPSVPLYVRKGSFGETYPTWEDADVMVLENSSGYSTGLNLLSNSDWSSYIAFSTDSTNRAGYISYVPAAFALRFSASGTETLVVSGDNTVGIGTSTSPEATLHVRKGSAGTTRPTWASEDVAIIENEANNSTALQILAANDKYSSLYFSDNNSRNIGGIMYNHADNSMRFRAGGTNSMTIDNNGYVGIGTTNPTVPLMLQGTAGNAIFNIASSSGESIFYIDPQGEIGIGTQIPDASVMISATSSAQLKLAYTGSAHEASFTVGQDGTFTIESNEPGNVYIDPTSKLGVGTSSPQSELTIYGDVFIEGADRYVNFGSVIGESGYGIRDNGGTLEIKNDGTAWNTITLVESGQVGWVPRYYENSPNLQATSSLFISNNGNIGIGITNPTSHLGMGGDIDMNNHNIAEIGNLDIGATYGYGLRFNSGNPGASITWGNDSTHQFGGVNISGIKINTGPFDTGTGVTFGPYGEAPSAAINSNGTLSLRGFAYVGGARLVLSETYSEEPLASIHVQTSQGIDFLRFATSTGDVYTLVNQSGWLGLNTDTPDTFLHVGLTDPDKISGGENAYVAGSVEIDGVLYIDGTATSTSLGNFDLAGALSVGNDNFFINDSGIITSGTWQGDTIGIAYGGTGTSTAPSYGQMLVGNASGGFDYIASSTFGAGIVDSGISGQIAYYGSSGTSVSATSTIYLSNSGYIGIGTTSPAYQLDVYGNASIDGNLLVNNLNVNAITSGTWQGDTIGVSYGGIGQDSSAWTGLAVINNGTWSASTTLPISYGGTGTSTAPGYGEMLVGNASGGFDYIASSTFGAGIVDFGTSGQIAYYGSSGTSVSATSTIYLSNSGYVGIGTTTPNMALVVGSDYSSYFSVNDLGQVKSGVWQGDAIDVAYGGTGLSSITEGYLLVGGAGNTMMATSSLYISDNENIGIGTITPEARLTVVDETASSSADVFKVATSSDVFRITGNGDVYADGSFIDTGADYAEYFYTFDTDLVAGEVVCVDITNNNAVERCSDSQDTNVMGIVSTRPAIIGNAKSDYIDNKNYVVVGMLGQVPARVSDENGVIRPGDALTSAAIPGYIMKANPGDSTVGVALEGFGQEVASGTPAVVSTGEIKVLISRRNKSLTVEMVESKITDHIAAMEIEDEVQILISNAVDTLDLDNEIQPIVDEQIALFDARLSVEFNSVENQLSSFASRIDSISERVNIIENSLGSLDSEQDRINDRISDLNEQLILLGSGGHSSLDSILVDSDNGLVITNNEYRDETEPAVSVVEIVTATSTEKTAFVVNQLGDGDVVDFQADGVSIVNIADDGKVSVVGEMSVDGRLMVCSGAGCGESLDNAVDETMGDMGVEGKVVAGAFESVCEEGFVWVPGSSKYGTMPGFCVMAGEARVGEDEIPTTELEIEGHESSIWTNVSQGEAQLACQKMGDNYHLVTENEWLTIAENIIRVSDNDIDTDKLGLQLATSSLDVSVEFTLSNGNQVYDLVGSVSEWTDMVVTKAGLIEPTSEDWQEYYDIVDFRGFNIAPPYYYDSSNGIGRIKIEDNENSLRGFVRGETSLYDLNLSNAPTLVSEDIGFRCSK